MAETTRDRFQFHDLLREYAAECAVTDESVDQRDVATRRLFEWYLHTAHAALLAFYPQHPKIPVDPTPPDYRPLDFNTREQARRWFTAEHANLMAIVRQAPIVGQHAVGWQLPLTVDCYLADHHHVADQITVHALALAAAQHVGHPLGQQWAYLCLGEAHHCAHQYDEAIACHQHALEIARTSGNAFIEPAALGDLAAAHLELRRYPEAADWGRQALNICRAIGQQRNEGLNLILLGDALRGTGEFDQALAHLRQSLAVSTKIGTTGHQAMALRSMARIYRELGQNDSAVSHLQRSAALSRELGIDYWYAETLNDLAVVLSGMARPGEARQVWLQALAIFADLDPHRAAEVRSLLDGLDSDGTSGMNDQDQVDL